ncbi:MAG: type II toxin-antitoxin system RelE/ParE family toxin [Archaeoglobaceae archaeon]|nr:type II toxin-antitoxin system RelE/ParE family toxin [Archaeoglobales archaeon]
MTYEVYLHPEVVKFLKKLPKEDVERIKAKLYELKNPHFVKSVKIKGGKAFRVRVGDYRIIYTLDEDRKVIVVFKIDRRERAYDRL